jgi:hypothetical protein
VATTPRIPPGTRVGDLLTGGECPRCGTPYDRFQEYCLECGIRLPADPSTSDALGAAVGRRSPWYAGDWLWPALVTLVVAILTAAVAVAIAETRSDDDEPTLVATSPQAPTLTGAPPEAPATTAPSVGIPEEEQPATTQQVPPPPPPRAQPRSVIAWPADRNGFTVVLASVPQANRAGALQRARDALGAGLTQVGVLSSSRYPSLHPGYLVVFSGVYPTLGRAQEASAAARGRGYGDAYAAQVAR